MKRNIKWISFILMISLFAVTACKLVVDLTINQPLGMNIPLINMSIPVGGQTNIYAETTISNVSKQAIGEVVNIEELRLDYILSNLSSNPVQFSLAISTNYQTSQTNQVTVYSGSDTPSYVTDPNQTAFIVQDIELMGGQSTNALYVASSVNPILIDALVYSDKYAVIVGTRIRNDSLIPVIATNDVRISAVVSVRLSKSLSDMPNVVSMFQ